MLWASRLVAVCIALIVVGAGFPADPAAAERPCWQRLINDWADDGQVEGTFPRGCYGEAIDRLPTDMRLYSSAEDDIVQALATRSTPAVPANENRRLSAADTSAPATVTSTGHPRGLLLAVLSTLVLALAGAIVVAAYRRA